MKTPDSSSRGQDLYFITAANLVTVLVMVLRRNKTNRIYIYIQNEVYYELAHAIWEGKKFHCLLSAIWKPRKATGIVPG